MADIVTPAKRSEMMSGIKGKDTKPEVRIRKLLFGLGYRYRTCSKHLPGSPAFSIKEESSVLSLGIKPLSLYSLIFIIGYATFFNFPSADNSSSTASWNMESPLL